MQTLTGQNAVKPTLCRPRKPNLPGICDREPDEALATYDDVVDDYIRRYRDRAQAERQFFKDCWFRTAIRYAGHCMRSDGKRHGHHQRRSQQTLIEVESALQECAEEMRACETFHELHELIHREIDPINDVGPLLVYDAATGIGAHLGLNPDRIYLHSGTATGANAVLRISGRKTINRSELPSAFMRLRCCEVEDCLCLYKRELARIARQKHRAN
jgi:hypothetical protein